MTRTVLRRGVGGPVLGFRLWFCVYAFLSGIAIPVSIQLSGGTRLVALGGFLLGTVLFWACCTHRSGVDIKRGVWSRVDIRPSPDKECPHDIHHCDRMRLAQLSRKLLTMTPAVGGPNCVSNQDAATAGRHHWEVPAQESRDGQKPPPLSGAARALGGRPRRPGR